MNGARDVGGALWAIAAPAVLLLAACSSGDGAGSDTATSTVTEATAVITEPSVVDTTSSTSSTSVSASTNPPPTSEVMNELEQVVRSAVDRAAQDFSACLVALPACDPASLAATRGEPILSVNEARVNEWNQSGYTVVNRDLFRYVVENVELSANEQQATVTVCFADGSKLVDPGAGPDGADLIVDGTFVSGREAWDMRLGGDGAWRVHDAPLVGSTEATDVCPAD